MNRHIRFLSVALAASALLGASAGDLAAQRLSTDGPLSNVILAGYGGAVYDATLGQEWTNTPNDFSASVSPILLFGMGEDLLFESELEFGVSGQTTTTTLEYAQIDYLGFEKFQFTAGKFLLPFGIFGERRHPSWINKLPTMPLLFGHAHGGVAEGSLLPILTDAGAMGRFSQALGAGDLNLSVFVTQGPRLMEEGEEPDGHAHSVLASNSVVAASPGHDGTDGATPGVYHIPDVGFGVAFADNNANKMIGGRLGYVRAPSIELYVSAFHAMYDSDSYLDYEGFAVSAQSQRGGFDIVAEAAYVRQEFAVGEAFEVAKTPAYYVEASRRVGSLEPVVRWSQLLETKVDGNTAKPGTDRLSLGLNYWIAPMVPLKAAYIIDPDFEDRILLQWAFGF